MQNGAMKGDATMRRDEAAGYQPAVAGGGKDKARIGGAAEKATYAGRGGRCTFPRQFGDWPRIRIRGVEVQILPGGLSQIQWAARCANTRQPATEARVRGIGCAGKGSHIIPSAWAPRQGARCEYAQHREANSDSFLAG